MSLLFHRRAISRAVAGELSPPAERRLFDHLGRCAPCRQHYDAASAVVARGNHGGPGPARERARLLAALGAPVAAPTPRRLWPVLAPALLAPALAAAVFLIVRRDPLRDDPEVGLRGGAAADSDDGTRAALALRFYARSEPPGEPAGPVRLVGELPGSGELRAGGHEKLQLAYTGLTAPRYLAVVARDASGALTQLYPRAPSNEPLSPAREPRLLGAAIDLGPLPAGRLAITAVVSRAPIDSARLEALLRAPASAPRGEPALHRFGGVLWVER